MQDRATTPPTAPTAPRDTRADLVDALLTVTRAMVALAARSLADLDSDVTLPQYRALIVLASRGPQRVVDISTELDINPSTATRMCDRLAHKGLIRRHRSTSDRRALRLALTPAGRALVQEVTRRRREELILVAQGIPGNAHPSVTQALQGLAARCGELPDNEWWLGWHDDPTGDDH